MEVSLTGRHTTAMNTLVTAVAGGQIDMVVPPKHSYFRANNPLGPFSLTPKLNVPPSAAGVRPPRQDSGRG